MVLNQTFTTAVGASNLAIAAVLLKAGDKKKLHPVNYYSRKFNEQQKDYSTREKEALILISSLQHYKIYFTTAYCNIHG